MKSVSRISTLFLMPFFAAYARFDQWQTCNTQRKSVGEFLSIS